MSAPADRQAFRFVQFEFPWALGPADGRYVVREAASGADAAPTHVLVLTTLGAPERRRLRRRRRRPIAPEPAPVPVTTTRATVVDAEPVAQEAAKRWLASSGTPEAQAALAQLVRAVRAQRLASADPAVWTPALRQALVVRLGFGGGEEVATGRWTAARELAPASPPRRRRTGVLRPQERVAALLGGHAQALACEELALRARQDLDQGQLREAALELDTAVRAAIAELGREARGDHAGASAAASAAVGAATELARRVAALGEQQQATAALADAALGGVLPVDAAERLATTLNALEAALRARRAGQVSG